MIGIKDFKMPKGCGDCACYDVEWARCAFVNKSAEDFDQRLAECPLVADVEPIKRGHWIGKPIAGYATVRCSNCKEAFNENNGKWLYCPCCGAKMDGEENE